MKLSREKRVILLAALAGFVICAQIAMFAKRLDELAEAITTKPESELPVSLRKRYVPTAERETMPC